MANEKPKYENKSTTQYSREGVNLRDLLAFQTGENGSFDKVISKAGVSRRDAERLRKAYNTVQNSDYDYILSEDGSGFNVFDRNTGAAQTKSSRSAGNTKGVNLADLVQLGDNVSKLAGFAAGDMDNYRKSLGAPREQTPPTPAMKTSDVNVEGTPIDLVDYSAPGAPARKAAGTGGKGAGTDNSKAAAQASGTPPPATPGTPGVNDRFEEALRRYQEGSNPNRFRGVDEAKLAEHMKGVKDQFGKRFGTLSAYSTLSTHPMFAHPNVTEGEKSRYAQTAADIYEAMVRDGVQPDIDEIASVVESDEFGQINERLTALRDTGATVLSLLPAGRVLGGLGKGLKNLSKYPKFAKWLASKGAGKGLGFPPTQSLPSTVSSGARRFLQGNAKEYMDRVRTIREMSQRMAYEGAGRGVPGNVPPRLTTGFGKGGKLPLQRNAEMAASLFSRAMNNVSRQYMGGVWNPRPQKFSVKSLMK